MAQEKRHKVGRAILGWLIVLAAIAAPVYYFLAMRELVLEVTVAKVQRGNVEQTISAISSGTVKPRKESMVAAGYMGKVAAIHFKEGDRVKAGDVIIELEHADLDAQVDLSEANVRVGRSRLEQAKIAATIYSEIAETRVAQAAAQLKVAEQDFGRIQALSERKAVSQSDLDKITLALRVSRETDAAARASQRENQVRQEEIRSAEAAIEQLEAALKVTNETRDKAFVRAPFDGQIAKIYVEVGESVGTGLPLTGGMGLAAMGGGAGGATPATTSAAGGLASTTTLVRLIDDTTFYVEAPFDEANASDIVLDQFARIEVDAYRDTAFPGTVEFISPIVTLNADLSRTLQLDVRIDEGQDKLIAGMSADVIIVVQEKKDVLNIPSEALVRGDSVYVVEKGRAVKRMVSPGIGNMARREITEGVQEGDQIITSVTMKELADGVAVRVVDILD